MPHGVPTDANDDIVLLVEHQLAFRRVEDVAIRCATNTPAWKTSGKKIYEACLERSGTSPKEVDRIQKTYFRELIYTLRDAGYLDAFDKRLKVDPHYRRRFAERQIKHERSLFERFDLTVRSLMALFLQRSRELEQSNPDGISIYISNTAEFALATWLDAANRDWRATPSTIPYYYGEPWYYSGLKSLIFGLIPNGISTDLTSDQRTRDYEWRLLATPALGERLTFELLASARFIGKGDTFLPGGQKNNILGGFGTLLYFNPFFSSELAVKGGLESETFEDPFGSRLPAKLMPGIDSELRIIIANHITVSPGFTLLHRNDLEFDPRVSIGFRNVNGFLYWWAYRFFFNR